MTNASGLAPTEIHITNASGELIKNGFRDRKAARAAARKLSRGGAVVYLVDATEGAKPIIEYRAGYQAGRTAPPHRGTASRRLAPERPPASVETLPDRLRPGLALVFVGLNPAEYSARVGHYYSKPGNVFWEKLSASGLVTGNLRCEDDHRLPAEFGIGLTDVVKRVVTDSAKVSRAEIRDAWPDFKERIAAVAPRMVCFNGAKAFGIMFPRVRAACTWGRQPVSVGGAEVWVMPSTSRRTQEKHAAHIPRVLKQMAQALDARHRPTYSASSSDQVTR